MSLDLIKERIKNKGIKAIDIKNKNLLTYEQIKSIKPKQAFAWVKTNQWKQKDFLKWLNIFKGNQNDNTTPT